MADIDATTMGKAVAIRAEMKKEIARLLTSEALSRLANVRAVKPQLALQAEIFVIEASKSGQLRPPISEEQLKSVLQMFVEKRKSRIVRK